METRIELYNKRERVSSIITVKQLAENTFQMIENDLANCTLTKGTEFETKINKGSQHEVRRILTRSSFITRRFILPPNYRIADYLMLGDELDARGGFWQVDFGCFLTVNIPKDFPFNVDSVIKEFDLNLEEVD
ncbi:hypothetical protein IDJ77_12650 [Mucilaginibacter sp. ZT4R22]|uniref:Uncharacterized protein n=1 Tax=Mucilaginibacter pankratovii TaxID=2772110 RepID=A0ABR7WQR0_9SPHI|nr:hypothetical protein [Mucilaginibacter pankratovii]MBD1364661.1 hypothetical protein [Mucilaginibacter pankratovii]